MEACRESRSNFCSVQRLEQASQDKQAGRLQPRAWRMAACRPLHTRRAADSENDDTDDARHHDGAKFFNPWVDPTEFSDSKVFAVAKFMCDSATKQVSDCATQQVKTRA